MNDTATATQTRVLSTCGQIDRSAALFVPGGFYPHARLGRPANRAEIVGLTRSLERVRLDVWNPSSA